MNTEIHIQNLLEESCTALALLGMAAEKRRDRIAEIIAGLSEDVGETAEGLYSLLAQSQNACGLLKQQLHAVCHVREILETDEFILQDIAPEHFHAVMVQYDRDDASDTMGSVYTEYIKRLCEGLSEFLQIRNRQMWALEEIGSIKNLPYPEECGSELRLLRMAEAQALIRRCDPMVQEQCAAVGALIPFLQQFGEDGVFSTGD